MTFSHALKARMGALSLLNPDHTFYEFFAGGGMARMGLGTSWQCLFANDICPKKCRSYEQNFGQSELLQGDIRALTLSDLPDKAQLAWASFPCQDLSLAGNGAGLSGHRSGSFWALHKLLTLLRADNRAPRVLVLENVCGTLTSNQGKDFIALSLALNNLGYRLGAMIMDAKYFVPQSRQRLFVVALLDQTTSLPDHLHAAEPNPNWHPASLVRAHQQLPEQVKKTWVWWQVPPPPKRDTNFADILEDQPSSVPWHTPQQTQNLLAMMSEVNLAKVHAAQQAGTCQVGTIYKRTRRDAKGERRQRAEVRFDAIAGCLRTPAGCSSRQILLIVEGSSIRSRLISSRETARLMGIPDHYRLPLKYNETYHLTGDGVVVPVVHHLSEHLLEPLLAQKELAQESAA